MGRGFNRKQIRSFESVTEAVAKVVLGKRVSAARAKCFFCRIPSFQFLSTICKMSAVVDAESEDPPTKPTADELKLSMGTCSADAGTQRSRVAVYFRLA